MARELYASLPLLTPNTIRLLHLDATDGSRDDRVLSGRLELVQLKNGLGFDALSYVWGCRTPSDPKILCGHHEIEVTENCYSALLHLRQVLGRLTIWVDAVCMNQEDDTEKPHQVALMEAIYSDARNVYIWLGPGSTLTQTAVRYLSTVSLPKRNWTVMWKPLRLPPSFYKCSIGLCEILDDIYMSRMWTFQELMLASNPVVVVGRDHIPWQLFARRIMFVYMTASSGDLQLRTQLQTWLEIILNKDHFDHVTVSRSLRKTRKSNENTTELYHQYKRLHNYQKQHVLWIAWTFAILRVLPLITALVLISRWKRGADAENLRVVVIGWIFLMAFGGIAMSLLLLDRKMTAGKNLNSVELPTYILSAAFQRRSTDPRDKFFGMRSVLERILKHPLPRLSESCSEGDAFLALTRSLLELEGSTIILKAAALCQYPKGPSWVPDWGRVEQHMILKTPTGNLPSRPLTIRVLPNGSSIAVHCLLTHAITFVHHLLPVWDAYSETERYALEYNFAKMSLFVRNYNTAAQPIMGKALERFSDDNTGPAWKSISHRYQGALSDYHRLLARFDANVWKSLPRALRKQYFDDKLFCDRDMLATHMIVCEGLRQDFDIVEYANIAGSSFVPIDPIDTGKNIRLFRRPAVRNALVADCMVGDRVALIEGMDIPVVLHGNEDAYRIIGTIDLSYDAFASSVFDNRMLEEIVIM